MKYVLSISLLIIYLIGAIQPSWILVDFYMNRDDYTQKYCRLLDQGITQCRASCYLDDLLAEQQNDKEEAQIIVSQQQKFYELISPEKTSLDHTFETKNNTSFFYKHLYGFDALQFVFHPPKA